MERTYTVSCYRPRDGWSLPIGSLTINDQGDEATEVMLCMGDDPQPEGYPRRILGRSAIAARLLEIRDVRRYFGKDGPASGDMYTVIARTDAP